MPSRRSIKQSILNKLFDTDPKRTHELFNRAEKVQRNKHYSTAQNYWKQYRNMKGAGKVAFKSTIVNGLEAAGGVNTKKSTPQRKTRNRKKKVVKRR